MVDASESEHKTEGTFVLIHHLREYYISHTSGKIGYIYERIVLKYHSIVKFYERIVLKLYSLVEFYYKIFINAYTYGNYK
jgi:hypothetical protein